MYVTYDVNGHLMIVTIDATWEYAQDLADFLVYNAMDWRGIEFVMEDTITERHLILRISGSTDEALYRAQDRIDEFVREKEA